MIKLLVVDDEKNIRRLYESELKREGYEVLTAANGAKANCPVSRVLNADITMDATLED